VESVITSPARRPPFEKTACECGDVKMEPTSAICPTKYTPNTGMKICQCLARRKKLVIPFKFAPEVRFKPTGGRLSQRATKSFSDSWSTLGKSGYRTSDVQLLGQYPGCRLSNDQKSLRTNPLTLNYLTNRSQTQLRFSSRLTDVLSYFCKTQNTRSPKRRLQLMRMLG
jgi:hypothetical protein